MPHAPGIGGFVGQHTPPLLGMNTILTRLGLTSGLKLCLDIGVQASYDSVANPQTWWDLSGSGAGSYYRGTTSGAEASDPTFNGTVGVLDRNTNFLFDGGDVITSATVKPAWADNIHKDGARYTLLMWVFFTSDFSGNCGLMGNLAGNAANTGFQFSTIGPNLRLEVYSGTVDYSASYGFVTLTTGWHLVAISVDENGGAVSFAYCDGAQSALVNANYAAPAATVATNNLQLGSKGNAVSPFASGWRMAVACAWEGVAPLTFAQLNAIFDMSKPRFLMPTPSGLDA